MNKILNTFIKIYHIMLYNLAFFFFIGFRIFYQYYVGYAELKSITQKINFGVR